MNPFTDYAAAEFLAFYAGLIGLVLTGSWWRWRAADDSRPLEDVSLAANRSWTTDPYAAAHLRGGAQEVARVAVVSLVSRGYLAMSPVPSSRRGEMTIATAGALPGTVRPPAIDRVVYEWFEKARETSAIPWTVLAHRLGAPTFPYEERQQREQLLTSDGTRRRRIAIAVQAAVVIGAAGVVRLAVGLHRQRPVMFLVLLGVAGLAGAVALGFSPRMSHRGARLVRALRRHDSRGERDAANEHGDVVFTAALFGFGALAATPFAALRPARTGADGGSSGCGGSGCGSDGGGGGCGGGGCGGCGG